MLRRTNATWRKSIYYFLETLFPLLLLLCSIWFCYTKYTAPPEKYFDTRTAIVAHGETLWSIAKREYPEMHPQEAIYYIREYNPGIEPGRLRRGQELKLPVLERE